MHTWSLAVEEQYYFVVPLIMYLALKFGKSVLCGVLALVFFASLLFGQHMVLENPSFNFLMLFTRAWELVMGAFVALYFRSKISESFTVAWKARLAWFGVLLLMASFALFGHETKHPGSVTLIPVIATALILMFSEGANHVGRMLSWRAFVLLGLSSYGSYLWHQPIFAFYRLISLEEPAIVMMLMLSFVAIALAIVTWKYVEAPFRKRDLITLRSFIPMVLLFSVLFIGTGGFWHLKAGFSQSTPEVSIDGVENPKTYSQFNMSVHRYKDREFHENGKLNVLVAGNSFARDFVNSGVSNGYFGSCNLVYRTSLATHGGDRSELNSEVIALVEKADYIIFASGYDRTSATQTMNTVELIREVSTAKFIVIGTKNFGWNNNAIMRLPYEERYSFRAKALAEWIDYEREALEVIPESIYVSIFDYILDDEGRVPVFTPGKKFISLDRRHLTQHGAEYLGGIIFEHPLLHEFK